MQASDLNVTLSSGIKLLDYQNQQPVLLVFLRHVGCTYCREAAADISSQRKSIEASGAKIVFVHMSSQEKFSQFLKDYNLSDCPQISDPDRALYKAFNLKTGSPVELFGPKVLLRAFTDGALLKHGLGIPEGDPFQMPGTFLIHKGKIIKSFVHKSIADRPDYCEIAQSDRT